MLKIENSHETRKIMDMPANVYRTGLFTAGRTARPATPEEMVNFKAIFEDDEPRTTADMLADADAALQRSYEAEARRKADDPMPFGGDPSAALVVPEEVLKRSAEANKELAEIRKQSR